MAELQLLLETAREQQYSDMRFAAALKGIDLDKETGSSAQSSFEEVKERAYAKAQGMTEDQYALDSLFDVEDEGDEIQ